MRRTSVTAGAVLVGSLGLSVWMLLPGSAPGPAYSPQIAEGRLLRESDEVHPELSGSLGPGRTAEADAMVSLSGIVVDWMDDPVAGASVSLGARSTLSRGDGTFEVVCGRDVDKADLVARKPGLGVAHRVVQPRRDRYTRLALPPAAPIRGDVSLASKPAPSVKVVLTDGDQRYSTQTDAGGKFSFESARTHACVLSVQEPGCYPVTVRVPAGASTRYFHLRTRLVPDVGVTIVDAAGAPVEGASVSAEWRGPRGPEYVGISDPSGRALRVPVIDPPKSIMVRAPGYLPHRLLVPLPPADEIVVVLRRGAVIYARQIGGGQLPPPFRWSLALDTNRNPPEPEPMAREPGFIGIGPGPSGASVGIVRSRAWFDCDPVGDTTVGGGECDRPTSLVAVVRDDQGRECSMRHVVWTTPGLVEGETVRWRVPALVRSTIRASVHDCRADKRMSVNILALGESQANFPVDMTGPRRTLVLTSGSRGVSDVWLSPGSHVVRARLGANSVARSFEVTTEPKIIDLEFQPGHSLRGRLMTAGGLPLPRREVTIRGDGGTQTTRTDAGGRFEFGYLRAGSHYLYYRGAREDTSEHGPEEVVVPGQRVRLVAREYSLRGTIRGALDASYSVRLAKGDAPPLLISVAPDGSFELNDLSAGAWTLRVVGGQGDVIVERVVQLPSDVGVEVEVGD